MTNVDTNACLRKGQILCKKDTHSDSTRMFSETNIIKMLEFLIDNRFLDCYFISSLPSVLDTTLSENTCALLTTGRWFIFATIQIYAIAFASYQYFLNESCF
jgi:hypothetical protein